MNLTNGTNQTNRTGEGSRCPNYPTWRFSCEALSQRLVGEQITGLDILRPIALRHLAPEVSEEAFIVSRQIVAIRRQGKFLIFALDDGGQVVFHLMLGGRLHYQPTQERAKTRDYVAFHLGNGWDLRFNDYKGMGKIYFTRDLAQVPGYVDLGLDALDPALTAEVFLARLAHERDEIKSILTRGQVVAGIGNAYADEILWRAGIYPFRKRAELSPEEQRAVYHAMHDVLTKAITTLRGRVEEVLADEVRDFLQIHGKAGQPCPRCGHLISEVKNAQRADELLPPLSAGIAVSRLSR